MKRPNPDRVKENMPGCTLSSGGGPAPQPAEGAERKHRGERPPRKETERRGFEAEREKKVAEKRRLEQERRAPFTDKEPFSVSENSLGLKFVLIPPGRFMMGDKDKGPVHEVELTRGFWLGETPVTQGQWEAVKGSNPSRFQGPDRPVECVSWDDAKEFIQRLNGKERTTRHRLPAEAEWEYACRSGGGGMYCFGNGESILGDYAWYDDNSGDETHPVGRKKPNAWGLYDMHGNVLEWCEDWYGDYLPGFIRDPEGPSSGSQRVLRGGSWSYVAKVCRSANRSRRDPGYRYSNRGFRLARSR